MKKSNGFANSWRKISRRLVSVRKICVINENELLRSEVDYPLRFGSPNDFSRVLDRLKQDDFQPAAVWKALAAAGLDALGPEGQNVATDQPTSVLN